MAGDPYATLAGPKYDEIVGATPLVYVATAGEAYTLLTAGALTATFGAL